MPSGYEIRLYTLYIRVHAWTYRRGLRCCCLDLKAIPEPRLAEQQQCESRFIFVNAGTLLADPAFLCVFAEREGLCRCFESGPYQSLMCQYWQSAPLIYPVLPDVKWQTIFEILDFTVKSNIFVRFCTFFLHMSEKSCTFAA